LKLLLIYNYNTHPKYLPEYSAAKGRILEPVLHTLTEGSSRNDSTSISYLAHRCSCNCDIHSGRCREVLRFSDNRRSFFIQLLIQLSSGDGSLSLHGHESEAHDQTEDHSYGRENHSPDEVFTFDSSYEPMLICSSCTRVTRFTTICNNIKTQIESNESTRTQA